VREAAAAAAAATGQKVVVKKTVMQLTAHPQSAIGGHQMPMSGRIGGAKGVGSEADAGAEAAAAKVGCVHVWESSCEEQGWLAGLHGHQMMDVVIALPGDIWDSRLCR
jgi:hypothetical protein